MTALCVKFRVRCRPSVTDGLSPYRNALICAALIFQVFISMKLTQKSKTLSGGHIFWVVVVPFLLRPTHSIFLR